MNENHQHHHSEHEGDGIKEAQASATHTGEDSETKGGAQKNIGMAVIAYILFFVPLLTDAKNDPFVKFHVKQGLVLLLTQIVISIVGSVIPFLGWFLILPLGSIFVFILWIMGILNAVNGTQKELPLIGGFATHFTF
jgi:uncharacterized membrane protein